MPETGFFDDTLNLLRSQRRLLLLGSPGSGKSWLARRLVREAIAQANYQLSYDQLSAPAQDLLAHFGGPVRRIQLHPAWTYELFIEGLRPEVVQGQASAVLRDGAFKRFCRDAAARPELGWGMILDDVHRCDIAALFGDCLPLLESPEARIWLPASADSLTLSPRALLIATCQRRDLAKLDPIWLRQFGVVELEPDYAALPMLADQPDFAPGKWLAELNARLGTRLGPAGAGELLGQGYFFFDGQPPYDFTDWQTRLRLQVWPRLQQLSMLFGFELKDLVDGLDPAAEPERLMRTLRAEFAGAFDERASSSVS